MDFRQLFKLRLVVAAMGETQRLGWWNNGVLSGTGEFLFQQAFPSFAPFAQTRAGFRVAQLACDEAVAIQPTTGGPITCHLFPLTPELENAFENERNRWMGEPEPWVGPFQSAWTLTSEQGPQALIELNELDPIVIDWARRQTPLTAKALRLYAGLLQQGQMSQFIKNSKEPNQQHAAGSRLSSPKNVNSLCSMLSRAFGCKYSVFQKAKEGLASIGIRLTDGSQPSIMGPRQKGGFIGG